VTLVVASDNATIVRATMDMLQIMKPKAICGFLGLLLGTSIAFAAELPDYPFVFVVGKADIETPPDMAACSLTLRAREQDPARAASIVEDRLTSVLATLKANHIAPKDIESFNIEKQVLTNDDEDKQRAIIKGYDVWRKLNFTARKLESIAPIETSLVRSPNIANITCGFDRTDRAVIEGDLMTKALKSAREEADKLAGPLGRRVTAAQAISRVPFDSIAGSFGLGGGYAEKIDRMFKRSVGDDLRGDDLLVPSTIQMTVSVNVLFRMD
jgi:uncharacterized protein YggE